MNMNFIKSMLYVITVVVILACGNPTQSKPKSAQTNTKISAAPAAETKQISTEQVFDAALQGKEEVIKNALDNGFDINTRGEAARTVLMMASFNGHTEIVKMLLEKGAEINAKDMTDRTALMYASTGPFAPTVKVLLEAGAQVNLKDNHENWTAFMFAAGEGQIEILKLLLDAGADVNALDVDGESAYDFAMTNKHPEAAAFIKPLMKK